MATGSSWDTYSEPEKKGMGAFAKVLVGCGIAALLLLGSCLGFAYWATHSGGESIMGFASAKVSGIVEAPWSDMVQVAEAIKTDEGALKLYEENRRLAEQYASKEAFLRQAKVWRTVLSELPAESPSIDQLRSGKFEIIQRHDRTSKVKYLTIRCETPSGAWITLNWEDGKLAGIDPR